MSETSKYVFLTTKASYWPSLLSGHIEKPGLYNWIRAFQREDTELKDMLLLWKEVENNPTKLGKYDIIHINLAGGDYGLATKVAQFVNPEKTKIVVNTDYAPEYMQATFAKSGSSIEVVANDIESADLAFAVEPFTVSTMNMLMTAAKSEKRVKLMPHPIDCVTLMKPPEQGGSFLDFDDRNDWLAFQWHRYDKALSIPRIIMSNLPAPEGQIGVSRVLFGWRPEAMNISTNDMMEMVVPSANYFSYLMVLSHCLWGFEYRFHHAASRFIQECASMGIPVVSNTNSYLGTEIWPELCFAPIEMQKMNEALCSLIQDNSFRREMVKQGLIRIRKYSLANSRNRMLELLNNGGDSE